MRSCDVKSRQSGSQHKLCGGRMFTVSWAFCQSTSGDGDVWQTCSPILPAPIRPQPPHCLPSDQRPDEDAVWQRRNQRATAGDSLNAQSRKVILCPRHRQLHHQAQTHFTSTQWDMSSIVNSVIYEGDFRSPFHPPTSFNRPLFCSDTDSMHI